MYAEEDLQVANPVNRFAIGDRDHLKFNPDGALTSTSSTNAPQRGQRIQVASRAQERHTRRHHAPLRAQARGPRRPLEPAGHPADEVICNPCQASINHHNP
jgi:Protein of unknown function (DUF1214)